MVFMMSVSFPSYYLSISRQNYGSILKDTRKNVKHRYKIGEFDE